MNKIVKLIGALLLLAIVAAGSFWGGMTYQSNQARQAQAAFIAARGQGDGGAMQFPGEAPGSGAPTGARDFPLGSAPGGAGFGDRGTLGQVKSVDGGTLQISTARDVTTVNLSESTRIVKSVDGSTADLLPGTRVMVAGQEGKDGEIDADQITILNGEAGELPFGEPPVGTPAGQQP